MAWENLPSTNTPLNATNLLDNVYPVGSIYMSVNSTNPATLFGGTWETWGAGRVPIGVDINDTDFDTVEKTGGEKEHTLTVTEMPSHTHNAINYVSGYSHGSEEGLSTLLQGNEASSTSKAVKNTGGGQAHNIVQPYITCYMWKRIA